MLSPKAMKCDRDSSGGGGTVTWKVQLAVAAAASVAVQVTGVVPTAKACPEPGAHAIAIGRRPPLVAASG